MSDILTDFSASALTNRIKGNLYEYFQYIAFSKKAEALDSPALLRWYTFIDNPWLNGILCRTLNTDADIRRIMEEAPYFRSKSVHGFNCWPPSDLTVETWKPRFEAYGFRYDANTPGMSLGLDTLKPVQHYSPEIQIEHVTTLEQLRVWTRTFIKGFQIPPSMENALFALVSDLDLDWPNRNYIGYLHGEPVATSNVFLGAGVAGIQYVSTCEAARGRGIGAAMTIAPLHDAMHIGYKIGTLQSSEMGQSVYKRIGFEHVCQMEHFYYAIPPSEDAVDNHT
ncbi:MAG: GNAT family N-acetyltransferase [Caldilineaceae bacterium]